MTQGPQRGGKLPGKSLYAGRRRAMTRTSGFKVNQETSGGKFRRCFVDGYLLQPGETVTVTFSIAGHAKGDLIGYGIWFWRSEEVARTLQGGSAKITLTDYRDPSWDKAGSIWPAQDDSPVEVTLKLTAKSTTGTVALYAPTCGRVWHKHLDDARPQLIPNMYQFAPEALFISKDGAGIVTIRLPDDTSSTSQPLILKSCNRCGRYLPVNVPVERNHLSFSNHCVAEHRRPCRHSSFGRLRNVEDTEDLLQLEYGYQLECRFCKKFEVNAAHNPQRTWAQRKEDGARRRAFEFLLAELYDGTPQLRYRHENGTELAEDVWKRFECACFNCGAALPTPGDMQLDHTRPLALLWPLDRTATALCGSCNSEKRDRPPSEFYSQAKLAALAKLTGIALDDLANTQPNEEALALLHDRLDWFFDEFLRRDEMTKERDGKTAGELVVKALHKVFARSGNLPRINLLAMYNRRQT